MTLEAIVCVTGVLKLDILPMHLQDLRAVSWLKRKNANEDIFTKSVTHGRNVLWLEAHHSSLQAVLAILRVSDKKQTQLRSSLAVIQELTQLTQRCWLPPWSGTWESGAHSPSCSESWLLTFPSCIPFQKLPTSKRACPSWSILLQKSADARVQRLGSLPPLRIIWRSCPRSHSPPGKISNCTDILAHTSTCPHRDLILGARLKDVTYTQIPLQGVLLFKSSLSRHTVSIKPPGSLV